MEWFNAERTIYMKPMLIKLIKFVYQNLIKYKPPPSALVKGGGVLKGLIPLRPVKSMVSGPNRA